MEFFVPSCFNDSLFLLFFRVTYKHRCNQDVASRLLQKVQGSNPNFSRSDIEGLYKFVMAEFYILFSFCI